MARFPTPERPCKMSIPQDTSCKVRDTIQRVAGDRGKANSFSVWHVRMDPPDSTTGGVVTAGRLDELSEANRTKEKGKTMLSWTLTFLVIALIAALLGFAGLAGLAASIAKVLFVIFLVLFLVSLINGRRRGV